MKHNEWLSASMDKDLKKRIQKAAAKNNQSVSEYIRMGMTTYMKRAGDWTIYGSVVKGKQT